MTREKACARRRRGRTRVLVLLLLLLLLGSTGTARADEDASEDPYVAAAHAVAPLLASGDVEAVRERLEPAELDPWILAHEVWRLAGLPAARTLAGMLQARRAPGLASYLDAQEKALDGDALRILDARRTLASAGPIDRATALPVQAHGEHPFLERLRRAILARASASRGQRPLSTEASNDPATESDFVGWNAAAWHARDGRTFDQAARAARKRRDLADNLRFLRASWAAWTAAGEHDVAAIRLGYVGNALAQLGELQGARKAYDDALRRMGPDVPDSRRAVTLRNYGLALTLGGEYAAALRQLERAEPLQTDVARQADIRLQRATIHARLGDARRAEALAAEAVETLRSLEDRRTTASALARQANIALWGEDLEQARAGYAKAAHLYETLGARGMVARCLCGEALALRRLGQLDEASSRLQHALREAEAADDEEARATARTALGELALARGQAEAARPHFLGVLAALQTNQSLVRFEPSCLDGLARAALQQDKAEEALEVSRRALDSLERGLLGLDERVATLGWEEGARPLATGLSAALAVGNAGAFSELLERSRASQLLQCLDFRERLKDAAVPASLRQLEAERRIAASIARRAYRDKRGVGDGGGRARSRAMREAQDALIDVLARIQRDGRARVSMLYPTHAGLATLRQRLQAGETLVCYALMEDGAPAALVARHDEARLVALPDLDTIERACEALALDDRDVDPSAALAKLRSLVLTPLAVPDTTTRLLIAPDGPLVFVPFAALRPDLEIAYVPSGSTLERLRADRRSRGTKVLALGDPAYTDSGEWLPASRAEAEAVGDVLLLGADAREGRLRRELAKPHHWRAVHLACHGDIDASRPMFSSLRLAPGDGTPEDDGALTWHEVFALRIRADLVVLSACKTARGPRHAVEGVRAFPRAFLQAGVPQVVVSLWPVPDAATSALMKQFHELLGSAPPERRVSTAAALQGAQAHLRTQTRWRHPRYWAAWQLWGRAD